MTDDGGVKGGYPYDVQVDCCTQYCVAQGCTYSLVQTTGGCYCDCPATTIDCKKVFYNSDFEYNKNTPGADECCNSMCQSERGVSGAIDSTGSCCCGPDCVSSTSTSTSTTTSTTSTPVTTEECKCPSDYPNLSGSGTNLGRCNPEEDRIMEAPDYGCIIKHCYPSGSSSDPTGCYGIHCCKYIPGETTTTSTTTSTPVTSVTTNPATEECCVYYID